VLADKPIPEDNPSETVASAVADLDELEFPPITYTEEDGNDAPWITQAN
jgi:hypothetical protein